MSRETHRFRQREVTRALKAAAAGGLKIDRVEIATDGRVVLVAGKQETTVATEEGDNEWDQI
jgi:hypothetical protein